MKLFQITVRNCATGKCMQSVEVYAEQQHQAVKAAMNFFPGYMEIKGYTVKVKVLKRGYNELRRIK